MAWSRSVVAGPVRVRNRSYNSAVCAVAWGSWRVRSQEAAESSRAWVKSATSPDRDRLDEDVPERRRLGRAGEHGQPGDVGRELAQQPVACTPSDDVENLKRRGR